MNSAEVPNCVNIAYIRDTFRFTGHHARNWKRYERATLEIINACAQPEQIAALIEHVAACYQKTLAPYVNVNGTIKGCEHHRVMYLLELQKNSVHFDFNDAAKQLATVLGKKRKHDEMTHDQNNATNHQMCNAQVPIHSEMSSAHYQNPYHIQHITTQLQNTELSATNERLMKEVAELRSALSATNERQVEEVVAVRTTNQALSAKNGRLVRDIAELQIKNHDLVRHVQRVVRKKNEEMEAVTTELRTAQRHITTERTRNANLRTDVCRTMNTLSECHLHAYYIHRFLEAIVVASNHAVLNILMRRSHLKHIRDTMQSGHADEREALHRVSNADIERIAHDSGRMLTKFELESSRNTTTRQNK